VQSEENQQSRGTERVNGLKWGAEQRERSRRKKKWEKEKMGQENQIRFARWVKPGGKVGVLWSMDDMVQRLALGGGFFFIFGCRERVI
jgi:hypothetical protein